MSVPAVKTYKCAACGRRLKHRRWVVGRDRRITGRVPRYCWSGEGCNKAKP